MHQTTKTNDCSFISIYLLTKGLDKDVSILCNDGSVAANSTLACFASTQLQRVFIINKATSLTIYESCIKSKAIIQLMELVHVGQIDVPNHELADFHAATQYLRMGPKIQRIADGKFKLKICEEAIISYFKFVRKHHHGNFLLLPSTGECIKVNPIIMMVSCNKFLNITQES